MTNDSRKVAIAIENLEEAIGYVEIADLLLQNSGLDVIKEKKDSLYLSCQEIKTTISRIEQLFQ